MGIKITIPYSKHTLSIIIPAPPNLMVEAYVIVQLASLFYKQTLVNNKTIEKPTLFN